MVRRVLLIGFALALSAAAVPPPNLVLYGSFSNGDFTDWTTHDCTTACAYGTWTIALAPTASGTAPPSGGYAATTGCNGVDCNSLTLGNSFSQTLPTIAGQSYTLSFYYDAGLNASSGSELQVRWNGAAVPGGTIINAAASTWSQRTFTVTATGTSTVLEFIGEQIPAQMYVTGISVTAAVPATPIPAALPLVIAGLAGLALCWSFRRRLAPRG
jgi:hypothetical protein